MRYECPSCFLEWKDEIAPLERLSHPLCTFCSCRHTQKELLNWQMQHLDHINPKHFRTILRYFYQYVENEIKTIKEKFTHDK